MTYQPVTLAGTSEKQSKFAEIAKGKTPSADLSCILSRTCTTKKLISYHLSHNNYRNIELRHSSHQIDSLVLTQARVNQLPGSSDVHNWAVSVGSSVSDTCRKFWTFRRLEKFIYKSQNEEGEDMLSKANVKIELF